MWFSLLSTFPIIPHDNNNNNNNNNPANNDNNNKVNNRRGRKIGVLFALIRVTPTSPHSVSTINPQMANLLQSLPSPTLTGTTALKPTIKAGATAPVNTPPCRGPFLHHLLVINPCSGNRNRNPGGPHNAPDTWATPNTLSGFLPCFLVLVHADVQQNLPFSPVLPEFYLLHLEWLRDETMYLYICKEAASSMGLDPEEGRRRRFHGDFWVFSVEESKSS
ncbi:hypothetical protein H6P81_016918 [Aristolochia fimbriata]|uniref:Uncharacterized protein n=1 Tax=Aristolochia fimbriata TaxID=158543 RepID=A0AAV7DX16_ARIFI|nr:hypothetical protein H6P81_016918 [Aristolochia fimbriata]